MSEVHDLEEAPLAAGSPTWTPRPATAADLVSLEALEREGIQDPWSFGMIAGELEHTQARVWVAEGQGLELAGYAAFREMAGEAELLRIVVAPRWRRRGVAARLLAAGLNELASLGVEACFLEVRAGNRAAIALYDRLGFVEVARRDRYYPDGEQARLMRLDLEETTR